MISTAVVISCSVFQGKKQLEQKSTQRYSQYEHWDLAFHQKQQDSLSSYWYFSTDSPLWFHLDSGLWAKGGRLFAEQSNIKRTEENLQLQRANSEEAAASDLIVKREKDWLSLILIVVVLMAILVGLGYLAWKRIRK
ncbi:hypothetical protein HS960_19705 [Sphingobacterium paramultivorum]|uniref:Uncharacterized protein n=1 Tax=Sphingobacterium paramultivorum TaxID=2886510 RepID=A0A7G5E6W4_9SPHI|nr:hypothetical protein [Sphingobacterium paramultivorum]QMV69739.1 hypothetical protein HS960_19705 [Sphingobacterium paramultivorum]WSO13561.1 hypothetical protein VUL84_19700 [Sphingobacterium paramultivorum]